MKPQTKENIANIVFTMITDVRQWCESQLELWQQIPNLALEADGKNGYSDDLGYCYHYGFWRIWANTPRGGYLLTSVDCATGVLVNAPASYHKKEIVMSSDRDVLQLLCRLDDIDASIIIDALKSRANSTQDTYIARINPGWASKKEKIRQQYGLSSDKPYSRIKDLFI